MLAATGNMSTGGTSIDRTREAHPDNVEIAETAAQVVGLDVAGHRLHRAGHHRAGARAGRRDRRGQRRARLPHAHQPDRGRAAVRGQAGHRPALRARLERAHPDRRRDRHQRQDDDRAHDRPHPEADGPARGHDHDRRHRHRRPADPEGRHVRPAIGADGAPEPVGRHGRVRGRARRHPARGPGLRPQRRRRRDQRHRRPPRAARRRDDGPAGARQVGARGGRAARRFRGAQRRRSARRADGPPVPWQRRLLLDGRGRRQRLRTASTATAAAAERRWSSSRPTRAS